MGTAQRAAVNRTGVITGDILIPLGNARRTASMKVCLTLHGQDNAHLTRNHRCRTMDELLARIIQERKPDSRFSSS